VAYLRVSTEEQRKGYGAAGQSRRVSAWIDGKGHQQVGTFTDDGVSGSLQIEQRPGGRRLMDAARRREFDLVAVKAGDRIGRTGRAFWTWVWALEALGVHVALVNVDLDNTTPRGREELRRQVDYAATEWQAIRERTQDGIQEKAESGGFPGGVVPYGWRIQDRGMKGRSRLVLDVCPDPVMCSVVHEADVMRRAWSLVVHDHKNVRQTAMCLNAEGYRTRAGKLWTATHLRGRFLSHAATHAEMIYRNPATAGRKTGTKLGCDGQPLHGETTVIELPPLFTVSQVARLQQALERNRLPRHKISLRVHPLSKRVFGACGKHYTGYCKDERGERWYQCTGKNEEYPGAPVCTCSQIDAAVLERHVWDEVRRYLREPGRLEAMTEQQCASAAPNGVDYGARVAELQEQIQNQDAAISVAMVMAAKEKDAKTAMETAVAHLKEERGKLTETRMEVEAWRDEVARAEQQAKDLQALTEMAPEHLHRMSAAEQAQVLALLDVKVTLLGNIPRRVPKNDKLAGWFRDRDRAVPLLDDAGWGQAETVLAEAGQRNPEYRRVLDALLHKARTGLPWTKLPPHYGNHHSLFSRYQRWMSSGIWDQLMAALAEAEGTPLPTLLPPLIVETRASFVQ
jgi:DNA invertase Pin-like site-specific DNA recombinase/transposase